MARKEFAVLTPQMFYILLALYEPRHGYDVMQAVRDITDGEVQIGAGTLYALLPRFLEDGYIALVGETDRKKIYRITPYGKEKLEEERRRMEKMLEHSRKAAGK